MCLESEVGGSEKGVRQLPQTDTWAKGCVDSEGRLVNRRAQPQMRPLIWTSYLACGRCGPVDLIREGPFREIASRLSPPCAPLGRIQPQLHCYHYIFIVLGYELRGVRAPGSHHQLLLFSDDLVQNHKCPRTAGDTAWHVPLALASCSPSPVIAASCHAQLFHQLFP